MTIGTATVARTNVRITGLSVCSQSPRARLRTVRVGKTATQIMRASWCLVGAPGGASRRPCPWVDEVPGRPNARDARAAGAIRGHPPVLVHLAAETCEELVVRDEARRD